jgi:hypothetical protein
MDLSDLAHLWAADAPGELAHAADAVDETPNVGGCGQALVTVALALVRGTEAAVPHLEGCDACRTALMDIGTLASGVDAVLYFDRLNAQDTETPHAAEFGDAAA